MAGGTDLLLELERGETGFAVEVVDVSSIVGFDQIKITDDSVIIGGGTTHGRVVRDPRLRTMAWPLVQACAEIGSPQLRNRATVAGNLATASPANDTLTALVALDARVNLARQAGEETVRRIVPIDEFFIGFRQTVLDPGELIESIEMRRLDPAIDRGIWVKLGNRRAQAISVVHAAAVLSMDGPIVASARLSIGSVSATVGRCPAAEDALVGHELTEDRLRMAATAARDSVAPIDDVRATAEYRSSTVEVLVERALATLTPDAVPVVPSAATVTLGDDHAVPTPTTATIVASTSVGIRVNGKDRSGSGGTSTLLDWLREVAALTGTKEGCAEGECGACTVLMNGDAVMSCLVTTGQADGSTITTVEGLAGETGLDPIQRAFIDDFAVQCGFCIPGFVVAARRLLDEHPDPDDDQIREGLSGNVCRCTGYYPMFDAVRRAASDGVSA